MAVRDVGIRSIIPVRFDDEIEEDNRTRIEIKNRLDAMERAEPIELADLAYAPPINLEPIKIIPKKGEYGHPDFWKSEKELKNYMVESAKRSEKAKKFREDPDWVAAYNKRFPRFKTTVLPKKTEKIFDEAAALFKIKEKADAKGNYGVAAKCEELRGKLGGLYIERLQTMNINKELSEADINMEIRKIFPTKEDFERSQQDLLEGLYTDESTESDGKKKK